MLPAPETRPRRRNSSFRAGGVNNTRERDRALRVYSVPKRLCIMPWGAGGVLLHLKELLLAKGARDDFIGDHETKSRVFFDGFQGDWYTWVSVREWE